ADSRRDVQRVEHADLRGAGYRRQLGTVRENHAGPDQFPAANAAGTPARLLSMSSRSAEASRSSESAGAPANPPALQRIRRRVGGSAGASLAPHGTRAVRRAGAMPHPSPVPRRRSVTWTA